MAFVSRWRPSQDEPKGPFVLNRDSPQANGLVFWMPCHPAYGVDTVNSAPYDRSLYHRHGSVLGTNAMSFGRFNDGTTGFLLTNGSLSGLTFAEDDAINMDGASQMSLMARFHANSGGSTDTIFGRPDQNDHSGKFWQYALVRRSSNEFMWFTSNGSTFNRGNHGSVSVDTDYHMVGTFNSDKSTEKRLYVDGVEIGTNDFNGVMSTSVAGAPLRIGSNADDGERWDGIVRDLRVYNRELTPAEVFLAYDPGSQWDLYHELGRRIHFFIGATVQTVNVGQATETDTALAVTPSAGAVSVAVGQATETDTALAVTPSPSGAVNVAAGQASETDTALAVTPSLAGIFASVGQAVETDTALAVTPAASGAAAASVAQASETDTALAITAQLGTATAVVGQAVEIDTALPVTPVQPLFVATGLAAEVDAALSIAAVMGTLFPNAKRTCTIPAERRTYLVPSKAAAALIMGEARSHRVLPENRTARVPVTHQKG